MKITITKVGNESENIKWQIAEMEGVRRALRN